MRERERKRERERERERQKSESKKVSGKVSINKQRIKELRVTGKSNLAFTLARNHTVIKQSMMVK